MRSRKRGGNRNDVDAARRAGPSLAQATSMIRQSISTQTSGFVDVDFRILPLPRIMAVNAQQTVGTGIIDLALHPLPRLQINGVANGWRRRR